MKQVVLTFCMLAAMASLALAIDGVSSAKGKELFMSKTLGTSGKSCNSCHPDGKGLEKAVSRDQGELSVIINQCIKKPLKGKALDPASNEMKSLIMYIKTLSTASAQR